MRLLFYARERLHQRLREVREQDAKGHQVDNLEFELSAGILFIEQQWANVLTDLEKLPADHINFEHLWILFPPESLVYATDTLGEDRVFRVRDSDYQKQRDGSYNFTIVAQYLDSNGRRLGYVGPLPLNVQEFSGSTRISELKVFPLSRHPEYPGIRDTLIRRGEKSLLLKGRRLQEYEGHAVDDEGKKFNVSMFHLYSANPV